MALWLRVAPPARSRVDEPMDVPAVVGFSAVLPPTLMEEPAPDLPAVRAARPQWRIPVVAAWLRRFHDSRLNARVAELLRNNPDMKVVAARFDPAAEQACIMAWEARPTGVA